MKIFTGNERKIYKHIKIIGDYVNKFTCYLPYLKPYDENFIVRSKDFLNPEVLDDEFDTAFIISIQTVFPGSMLQSTLIIADNSYPSILNLPTVRDFDVIVRQDLEGVDIFEGMVLDDFFVKLKLRFEKLPPKEIMEFFIDNHNVVLPFVSVKNYRNKIIPL